MRKIRYTIRRFIERHFKVWGVALETSLPPEFYVSKHAELRLYERVGVRKEKIPELVAKAFYAKEVDTPRVERAMNRGRYYHSKNRVARELMGKVYIFAYSKPRGAFPVQKVLITVI